MISKEEGKILLRLARNSIETVFDAKEPEIDDYCRTSLSESCGCFVTLSKNGQLRGCIGFPEPIMPLYKAIIAAARAAAFEDPRFPSVEQQELEQITIEISVLTKPERCKVSKPEEYLKKVRIGTDGLIIRGQSGSGLLLPQVATQWHWDAKKFLEYTCVKAGLEKDSWKELRNQIYIFQAQIFGETERNK